MKKIKKTTTTSWFIVSLAILFCSCSNTAMHREVVREPQVHKKDEIQQLVVRRALNDDVSSEMYYIQLIKSSVFQKSARNNTRVVIRRYPFSAVRKLDEIIIGVITVPFTPLAMIGGVVNDDPDLAFYPLSMLWPLRNFRPEKGGLLTGPVIPEEKTNIVEGNWQYLGEEKETAVLKNAKFKIQVNKKEARFHTDGDGVAIVNLSKIPHIFDDKGDIELNILWDNLQANHVISSQRLLVVRAKNQSLPKEESKSSNDTIFEDLPGESLPLDLSSKKEVIVEAKKSESTTQPKSVELSQIVPAQQPTDLIPNKVDTLPGMDRALLYKGLSHGYWIKKEDGFPIMALPNKPSVVVYGTQNLESPNGSTLVMGKEYYVFSFDFGNDNRNTAVKVGTSPFENNAYGWVYAKDLFLWNTLNRLSATKSFDIYTTHDDCLRGNDKAKKTFVIDEQNQDLYFPVLERKGSVWCIAYPDGNNHLKHGWIQWLSETGLQVEVRAMKHKIDMAINYLAKKVIIKTDDLEKQYVMELQGPLYLLKPKENMQMSSFVKEKESMKVTKARQIEAPTDEKEFEAFHQQVQELGQILTEKDVWQTDDDVLYIPAERD